MTQWLEAAQDTLLRLRDRTGAWGYRADRGPTTEATALVCLGLLSCQSRAPSSGARQAIERGSLWLQQLQQTDGSLGISRTLPRPGWATPQAMLVWNAVDLYSERRQRAAAWLLKNKGSPVAADQVPLPTIVGDNQSLLGWSWTAGAHSWLEPTALAVLALDREGMGDHPRVEEGTQMILDRALSQGGWNYGNKSVFRQALRPQPAPTGLALLALAAHTGRTLPRAVDPALHYLQSVIPEIRAPISLAWGVLGLRAWSACPDLADTWLSHSFALHSARRDMTAGLALLALAGGEASFLPRKPLP